MADKSEGTSGRVAADGGFAPAAGSDTGVGLRHRVFAGVWDSDGAVRGGGGYVWVECACDSSCKLCCNAPTIGPSSSISSSGQLDVSVGVEAGVEENAGPRRSDANVPGVGSCPGGVVGSSGSDGAAADIGFDSGAAAGSGAGDRRRGVKRKVLEAYINYTLEHVR